VDTWIYTGGLGPVTDSKSNERERNDRWERLSPVSVNYGLS
jgi:hypothetical protein